jgi:hypothetical protein
MVGNGNVRKIAAHAGDEGLEVIDYLPDVCPSAMSLSPAT